MPIAVKKYSTYDIARTAISCYHYLEENKTASESDRERIIKDAILSIWMYLQNVSDVKIVVDDMCIGGLGNVITDISYDYTDSYINEHNMCIYYIAEYDSGEIKIDDRDRYVHDEILLSAVMNYLVNYEN